MISDCNPFVCDFHLIFFLLVFRSFARMAYFPSGQSAPVPKSHCKVHLWLMCVLQNSRITFGYRRYLPTYLPNTSIRVMQTFRTHLVSHVRHILLFMWKFRRHRHRCCYIPIVSVSVCLGFSFFFCDFSYCRSVFGFRLLLVNAVKIRNKRMAPGWIRVNEIKSAEQGLVPLKIVLIRIPNFPLTLPNFQAFKISGSTMIDCKLLNRLNKLFF